MPVKFDYLLRETTSNLGRNVTITLASIMTVAVSLALVGASLMLRSGVENATQRWQGGIEFVVFLRIDANQQQIDSLRNDLEQSPEVSKVLFVDQQQAYSEFKTLFADSTLVGQTKRLDRIDVLVDRLDTERWWNVIGGDAVDKFRRVGEEGLEF